MAATVGERVAVGVGEGVRVGKTDVGVGRVVGARGIICPDAAAASFARLVAGTGVKVTGTFSKAGVSVGAVIGGTVAAAIKVGISAACVEGAWQPTTRNKHNQTSASKDGGTV